MNTYIENCNKGLMCITSIFIYSNVGFINQQNRKNMLNRSGLVITLFVVFVFAACSQPRYSQGDQMECRNFSQGCLEMDEIRHIPIGSADTHEYLYKAKRGGERVNIVAEPLSEELQLLVSIFKYGSKGHDEDAKGLLIREDIDGGIGYISDVELITPILYKIEVKTVGDYLDREHTYSILVQGKSGNFGAIGSFFVLGIILSSVISSLVVYLYFSRRKSEGTSLRNETEEGKADAHNSFNLPNNNEKMFQALCQRLDYLTEISEESKETKEAQQIIRRQKDSVEARLKEYQNGYNFLTFRNALVGLIEAYEYTNEVKRMLKNKADLEKQSFTGYIDAIEINLKQGLSDAGVEPFTADIGDHYQRAFGMESVGVIPTHDVDKVGTVAEVVSAGYITILPDERSEKQVVRKIQVKIFGKESENGGL